MRNLGFALDLRGLTSFWFFIGTDVILWITFIFDAFVFVTDRRSDEPRFKEQAGFILMIDLAALVLDFAFSLDMYARCWGRQRYPITIPPPILELFVLFVGFVFFLGIVTLFHFVSGTLFSRLIFLALITGYLVCLRILYICFLAYLTWIVQEMRATNDADDNDRPGAMSLQWLLRSRERITIRQINGVRAS